MNRTSLLFKMLLTLLLVAGGLQVAVADDDEDGSWWGRKHSESNRNGRDANEGGRRGGLQSAAPAQFQQECASCHMAYPAGLLPAGSWQHLMANLSQHFGSDASLDAASATVITQYLSSNAGTYKRVNEMPPQDRITQSFWFARKHDKHVDASTWARPSIGSRSNCVACHQGAEQGNFNEHSVRIPG
ncbi:MAG: diheme cytochrome c [Rhodoferax sp.]|uniref:diheme cytochrome c n=1 Tax=Rhodoferax sp. TaxID=50421 RepID=UPI00273451C3|nr:diheme cytochrome c [Rhodoferax sp.]MDP2679025.1 diheme cytochrome c [Rhodoferax sp.]